MIKTLCAALSIFAAAAAYAGDSAQVAVTEAWMRASLGQVPSTAAYFKVENRGAAEDKLLSVATPVAGMAHIHGTAEKNGVMTMNAVGPLVIKPGETLELAPGGLHVMVMNMKAPITAGTKVPLILTFERAGRVEVQAEVRGLNDAAGHKH